jgi:hypothetical protein
MSHWELLGLGCLGGVIVGSLFFALGMWLDRRERRAYMREAARLRHPAGSDLPEQRGPADGS